jgi:hypothetical protein
MDDGHVYYARPKKYEHVGRKCDLPQNNKAHADIGIPNNLIVPVLPTNLCVGVLPQGKVDSCNGDSEPRLASKA